jgi:hypothetical protein
MDLTKLSKTKLLAKCEELGFTKYKSKNKGELIELINSKNDKPNPNTQIEVIKDNDIIPSKININININPTNINKLNIFITICYWNYLRTR